MPPRRYWFVRGFTLCFLISLSSCGQPDLRKAYDSLGTKPLSVRVGYGYSRIASNLLLGGQANLVASILQPEVRR